MRSTCLASLLALVGCTGQLGVGAGATTAPASPPPPAPTHATAGASAQVSIDIRFYGVPLGGANDLVFVLDRSGSMASGKMADAKRELLRVIDQLPDGTRVGLVFFNSRVAAWTLANVVGGAASDAAGGGTGRRLLAHVGGVVATKASGLDRKLVPLSPIYRQQAQKFVRSIHASGSTAAVPALRAAASIGARHIVFLSDGLANTGGDGGELMALANELRYQGIRIDTVGLGRDQDYTVLREMAAATGGIAVIR